MRIMTRIQSICEMQIRSKKSKHERLWNSKKWKSEKQWKVCKKKLALKLVLADATMSSLKMMYINALQTWKKIAKLKTEIEIAMIFTHKSVRCSKTTSVIDEIIITKAKLQVIDDAIAICSEETSEGSEIWVYTDSQMTLQRLKQRAMSTWSYSITYNKIWLICNKIDVIFAYSEY